MVVECIGCHKSYDVSKYPEGARLRCGCGQIVEVPDASWHKRPVHTFHCSKCGGNLQKGDTTCPYCNALVDLSSARLTAYCPVCLFMSPEGSKYCAGCGAALLSSIERPEKVEERCPRCNVSMRQRQVESHRVIECPMCLGMFVSVHAFESLIRRQEDRVGETSASFDVQRAALVPDVVRYIKCPQCGDVMNRMNYARISGVIVDYCRRHGYWLDNGELQKVAAFVASGGLKEKYKLEMEEAKSALAKAKLDKAIAESAGSQNAYLEKNETQRGFGFSLFDFVSGLFD